MTPEELKEKVLNVKRWSKGDQRAPNKPLMMVYVLSKYLQGHGQFLTYDETLDREMKDLLMRYGPSRKTYHPEYPFWRLKNDGFWQVNGDEKCRSRKSNTDPTKSELIRYGVSAGFSDEAYAALQSDHRLCFDLIETILSESFPETLIPEIENDLCVRLETRRVANRDPDFRDKVLAAYNYRCAICGYQLKLNGIYVGLDAAHIKWKKFNGPCCVKNGLALCALHH
ncbi:phosphorothioated DNA-binding restriction endonuclease [Salinibius halmophilus]|uniref:phosphorothioated DNA-binding restriction endonuclease n=1 Tax=Salinibius halmophilus TaxID=1853216 RepID=UPI0018F68B54|nr:HNH endonuclease [Salinibius halmophilus]